MGRKTIKKSIVAIAVEVRGRGSGRVRMSRVNDVSAASLLPFVQAGVCLRVRWCIQMGGQRTRDRRTLVMTIGRENISASGDPAHTVMPRVHRVAALLDRWWLGTHQGAISPKHLDYYLDEYTFRFNRRRSRAPGMLFYRLLEQSLNADPVAYSHLVGGKSRANPRNGGQAQDIVVTRAKWIAHFHICPPYRDEKHTKKRSGTQGSSQLF